jgi:hypothetical protein
MEKTSTIDRPEDGFERHLAEAVKSLARAMRSYLGEEVGSRHADDGNETRHETRWLNAAQAAELVGLGRSTLEKRVAHDPALLRIRDRRGGRFWYPRHELIRLRDGGHFSGPWSRS